jgi:mRNA interferase RelE/StbE
MIVEFDKSFEKSLEKIRNKSLFPRIKRIIIDFEKAGSLAEIPNVIKLTGYKHYYRLKIGEYRLGFEKISEDTLRFIVIAHRKDIYRQFP